MSERSNDPPASYPKTAACACGSLTVTVAAPPQAVHACACLDCQRGSGSAFSYSAFFPESAVTVAGELDALAAFFGMRAAGVNRASARHAA